MRPRYSGRIAGTAMAVLALAGCGEDPATSEGVMPFQGTNTSALDPMRREMQKSMQTKGYMKKSDEDGKPAVASQGVGESQPATESKPAKSAKPSTESQTGAESKPVTKGG
jgi:hypothetical protein